MQPQDQMVHKIDEVESVSFFDQMLIFGFLISGIVASIWWVSNTW